MSVVYMVKEMSRFIEFIVLVFMVLRILCNIIYILNLVVLSNMMCVIFVRWMLYWLFSSICRIKLVKKKKMR